MSYCYDAKSEFHERGWREFLRRYKKFMYNIIINTCRQYRVTRLNRQFSETVNDIFNEALNTLLKDDYRALRSVQAKDNEKQFLSWLAVTCHRCASANIKKYFKNSLVETDPTAFAPYMNTLSYSELWPLYEELVNDMRSSSRASRKNLERDIYLFMLYKWEQLPQPMIRTIPCFKKTGIRVIEVATARMLKYLKELRKYENR
ncbi:MAG: hypothetical protein ACE5IY_05205 [bacterium]